MLLGEDSQVMHVWHHDGDKEVLKGVPIYEDLRDLGYLRVNILELLWGDVLTLRKLEDVLRPIYDLDGTVGEDHADIPRVQPAIIRECLLCLLWILKVLFENVSTFQLNLTTRWVISREVAKLGAIFESDFIAWNGSSHMAIRPVKGMCECSRPCRFGLTIALVDVYAKS
jgi:hypothetical protein